MHFTLQFCKGISQDDEPDLWQKALDGEILLMIQENVLKNI
ncbi:MAG: YaeQ family protein [Sulfurimonas sp.]